MIAPTDSHPWSLEERLEFAEDALADGSCKDARDGLASAERLGVRLAAGSTLHQQVAQVCQSALGR